MWELALVLAASALGCVAVVYFLRLAPRAQESSPAEPLRDDLLLALATAAAAFLLAALRGTVHPFDRVSLRLGGFLAASVALGALVTLGARELRRRFPPTDAPVPLAGFAPAALFHPLASSLLLGGLVAIASATSHALGDPQRLAPAILPLVVGFALGALVPTFGKAGASAATNADGALALETCAAMTLGVHFFTRDGGLLGPAALRASALSLVFAPLVLRALFAATTLAAAFAFRRTEKDDVRALGRAFHVGVVLATLALAGTSFALLGPLALPSLFAGAAGAAATMLAWAIASRTKETSAVATIGGTLVATAVAATIAIKLLSLTDARHGALFGIAYAALGARGASGLLDVIARASDDEAGTALDDAERTRARAARLPAEALGVLLVPLAVGAAAMAAACGRWAATTNLPLTDGAELLTQCELAGAAGAAATVLDPAPLAAALLGVGLTALRPPAQFGSRIAGVLVAAVGVAIAAVIGHVVGGGAQGALAACALAAGITSVIGRLGAGPPRAIGASGALLGAMALAFAPMFG